MRRGAPRPLYSLLMPSPHLRAGLFVALSVLFVAAPTAPKALVQTSARPAGKTLYDRIKGFTLSGGVADVSGLVVKRDRVEMTFTGTFYLGDAENGRVTGAVFVGEGTFRAAVPVSVG